MATISLKKVRALELARFLKSVTPSMFQPKSEYFKSQKLRVNVEKAIQDFKKVFDDYLAKVTDEVKPFQEELKEFEAQDPVPTKEQIEVKQNEVNGRFNELMKPFKDSCDEFEKVEGQVVVAIDVNEEDLNATKTIFTNEGENMYTFLAPNGQKQFNNQSFLELAEALGLTA